MGYGFGGGLLLSILLLPVMAAAAGNETATCHLTLDAALNQSASHHPAMHLAHSRQSLSDQSLALSQRQRWPQWSPSLSTSTVRGDYGVSANTVDLSFPASWTAPWGSRISAGPVFSQVDERRLSRFAGQFEQPLGRGFGRSPVREAIEQAQDDAQRAELAVEQARRTTRSAIVQAYYGYARSRERREVGFRSVERLQPDVLLAQARQRAGLGDTGERLNTQLQLKQAQEQAQRFEELEKSLYEALLIALQIAPSTACDIAPPPLDLAFDASSRDLDAALRGHPDTQALELDRIAAQRAIEQAEQNLKPQLDLVFGYSQVNVIESSGEGAQLNRDGQWSVGLRGALGNDRRRAKLDLERARLQLEELELREDEFRRTLNSRLRLALDAVERAKERVELLRQLREDAESRVRLARLKLTHGLTQARELVDAEDAWQRIDLQWVDARYDHALAVFAAWEVLGVDVEAPSGSGATAP